MSAFMLGAPMDLADRGCPGDVYYARSRIDPACRVIPLVHPEGEHGDAGLLVVDTRKGLWTEFAVLEWCEDSGGENWYEVVFHGEGPAGERAIDHVSVTGTVRV